MISLLISLSSLGLKLICAEFLAYILLDIYHQSIYFIWSSSILKLNFDLVLILQIVEKSCILAVK